MPELSVCTQVTFEPCDMEPEGADMENNNNNSEEALNKLAPAAMDCDPATTFPCADDDDVSDESYEEGEWEMEPFDPYVDSCSNHFWPCKSYMVFLPQIKDYFNIS